MWAICEYNCGLRKGRTEGRKVKEGRKECGRNKRRKKEGM
jgi:hypothetical protein